MTEQHRELTPEEFTQVDAAVGSGIALLRRRRRRAAAVVSGGAAVAVVAALAGTALVAGAMLRAPDPVVVATPSPSASSVPPAPSPSSSSPTPTSTSTPPVSTASPPSVNDPADPATWIVSDEGMGPFRLGMPFEDAASLIPDRAGCGLDESVPSVYFGDAHRLWIVDGRQESGASDGLSLVEWSGFTPPPVDLTLTPRTEEGIGLGSTEAEARRAYPNATETFRNVDYLVAGRVYFGLRDGIVQSIGVTATDPPYEFCG
jgi:hypothetical protein